MADLVLLLLSGWVHFFFSYHHAPVIFWFCYHTLASFLLLLLIILECYPWCHHFSVLFAMYLPIILWLVGIWYFMLPILHSTVFVPPVYSSSYLLLVDVMMYLECIWVILIQWCCDPFSVLSGLQHLTDVLYCQVIYTVILLERHNINIINMIKHVFTLTNINYWRWNGSIFTLYILWD